MPKIRKVWFDKKGNPRFEVEYNVKEIVKFDIEEKEYEEDKNRYARDYQPRHPDDK